MTFTEKELTIFGWIVVPILTAIFTYFQQSRNDEKNEQKLLLKEKKLAYEKLLIELEDFAIEFWINDGNSRNSIRLSVKIKQMLKILDNKLPNHSVDVMKLRQEITGYNFDEPDREGLSPTHERFHNINTLIIMFKTDKSKLNEFNKT